MPLGMPLHAQLIHMQPLLIANSNLCDPVNPFLCELEAGMKRPKELKGRLVDQIQYRQP